MPILPLVFIGFVLVIIVGFVIALLMVERSRRGGDE
jgi:hypothetical protein